MINDRYSNYGTIACYFSVILWKPEREGDQKEANGRKIIKTIKNKDG